MMRIPRNQPPIFILKDCQPVNSFSTSTVVLAASGCERTQQRLLTTRRKAGKTCPPSEDLEDLEQSGKAFKSGEEKAVNY